MKSKKVLSKMKLKWVAAVTFLLAICIFGGLMRANAGSLESSSSSSPQSIHIICNNDVEVIKRDEYGFGRLLSLLIEADVLKEPVSATGNSPAEGLLTKKELLQLNQGLFTATVTDICIHNNPEEGQGEK